MNKDRTSFVFRFPDESQGPWRLGENLKSTSTAMDPSFRWELGGKG